MSRDSATAKNRNRRIRQEALREQLQAQGHVQHVVDILEDLNNEAKDIDQAMVQRKKIVLDTKLRLINKYLPDTKSVEIVDEDGNDALPKAITINVVSPT